MVAIDVGESSVGKSLMIATADDLHRTLKLHGVDFTQPDEQWDDDGVPMECTWPEIQASYNPEDGSAIVVLFNVTSDMVTMR